MVLFSSKNISLRSWIHPLYGRFRSNDETFQAEMASHAGHYDMSYADATLSHMTEHDLVEPR